MSITTRPLGAVSTVFNNDHDDTPDEFSGGVQGGFGVVSFRSSKWRVVHKGVETLVRRPEPPHEPVASLEAVIVRGSKYISKTFYEKTFVDGEKAAPDCFSLNGVTPDVSAPKKQATTCAACPKGAYGSKTNPNGKPAKACSDGRRVAVVPLADIDNEAFGGPMLLRIPPTGLGELQAYDAKMRAAGYKLYQIATRISFDETTAYPRLVFSGIRPLTDEEAAKVVTLRQDARVERILHNASDMLAQPSESEAPPAPTGVFEQPAARPAAAAPKAATRPPVAEEEDDESYAAPPPPPASAQAPAASAPAATASRKSYPRPAPVAPAPAAAPAAAGVPSEEEMDAMLADIIS